MLKGPNHVPVISWRDAAKRYVTHNTSKIGACMLLCMYFTMIWLGLSSTNGRTLYAPPKSSYAYLTHISHSNHLPALLALAHSLTLRLSKYPLVVMLPPVIYHDASIMNVITALPNVHIERIRSPVLPETLQTDAYHYDSFHSLEALNLRAYSKLFYIRVYSVVHSNIDYVFQFPSMSFARLVTGQICSVDSEMNETLATSTLDGPIPTNYLPSESTPTTPQNSLASVPSYLHRSLFLLSPSPSLYASLYSTVNERMSAFHYDNCQCDDVVDLFSSYFTKPCSSDDATKTDDTSSKCAHILPLNFSLTPLTCPCYGNVFAQHHFPITELSCRHSFPVDSILVVDTAEMLLRAQQLTLQPVHIHHEDITDEDSQPDDTDFVTRFGRKYAQEYLEEQKQSAITKLLKLKDDLIKRGQSRKSIQRERDEQNDEDLECCSTVYTQWLDSLFESLQSWRPRAQRRVVN